jgi:hypothetical protein
MSIEKPKRSNECGVRGILLRSVIFTIGISRKKGRNGGRSNSLKIKMFKGEPNSRNLE